MTKLTELKTVNRLQFMQMTSRISTEKLNTQRTWLLSCKNW